MAESGFAYMFPGGMKKADVTSVTLVNNTAKTVDTVVPAGRRWLLLNIKATNPDNVARTINFWHYKEAAKTNFIKSLTGNSVAAAAWQNWPNTIAAKYDAVCYYSPQVLGAGECISVIWLVGGASTGGVAADGLVIEYLEMVG